MVKEAEAHAEEDKRRKELVEARNHADATIYSVEKALKEAEGRAPASLKTEIEQAVSALKDAMKGENVQQIKQATERLGQTSMRLAEAVSQPAPGPGADGAGPQSSEPGVVDAEFEEVDKRDRKAS
jgi:molecular chaperone DnaK